MSVACAHPSTYLSPFGQVFCSECGSALNEREVKIRRLRRTCIAQLGRLLSTEDPAMRAHLQAECTTLMHELEALVLEGL